MKKFLMAAMLVAGVTAAKADYLYWQVGGDSVSNLRDTPAYAQLTYDGSVVDGLYTIAGGKMDAYTTYDVSALSNGDKAFVIELLNSSGDIIGQGESKTYADLVSNGAIKGGQLTDIAAVQVWQGGTYSVPEPTGALLVMLGAACLALRRRERRS